MRRFIGILIFAIFFVSGIMDALAIEEEKYEVGKKDDKFEIRDYTPHVLVEMIVDGDSEDAGSKSD